MKYPSRIEPFEKLMYFLDRPNYPNNLGIRLRFQGRLAREEAIAAATAAAKRHPGFQVVVDRRRLEFVERDGPFDNFRWIELQADLAAAPLQPTDVHRDGGGMFWFVNGPAESHVALIGHHALTDGVGGLQVMADWMLEYDRLIREAPAKLVQLDPERLRHRGRLDLWNRKYLRKLFFQPVGLFGACKFLFRRVVPLLPASAGADRPLDPFPSVATRIWTREANDAVKSTARQSGVSANDVLTTALFLALSRWRARHTAQDPRDWIRLLIPISLRTMADRRLTACNRVSFVQIDRRPRDTEDFSRLLRSVARELGVIRAWQLDRALLIALRLASWVPGQIKRWAAKSCRATGLFTNLGCPFDRLALEREGDCLRVGDLRLSEFDMLAPLFSGIPLAIAVAEYLGRLTVSANYDPRVVDQAAIGELLDAFSQTSTAVTG
jgi:hypothetical protein